MRDVAKSFFRLSWAMTVFGVDQLGRLASQNGESEDSGETEPETEPEAKSEDRVARAMNSVSRNTEKQLEKRAHSMYEAGDKLQSEMVNLFFDSFKPEEWKPKRVLEKAADWADKSAGALRDIAHRDDSAGDEEKAN